MTSSLAAAECSLLDRFLHARRFSREFCAPLEVEDFVVQSMPDVSPTRWHLAHTTWFFETFLLKKFDSSYKPYDPAFEYLFNSYYNSVGRQFPRAERGLLSRPTVADIWSYRAAVDEAVTRLLTHESNAQINEIVEIGIQHEQQHQELMATDIKHVFSCNPLLPAYFPGHDLQDNDQVQPTQQAEANWISYSGGVRQFGHLGDGFCFDNETPAFEHLLQPNEIQDRLVTNREFLGFLQDGGYERPEFWLSMGWHAIQSHKWDSPGYWRKRDGEWHEFSFYGLQPLRLDHPVTHVSYFEADAYARWAKARLLTEFEWEHAVGGQEVTGNFAEHRIFHPRCAAFDNGVEQPRQMYGDLWEWTSSPYTPYPGYRPQGGALGEYNGKFMCNQFVLRGGSCATSQTHIRPTYRNFFPPEARWQFTGIRLAR